MFALKKILGTLVMPLPLSVLVLTVGVALLFTRRHRTGRALAVIGLLLLVLPTMKPVADGLLGPLERRYPAFEEAAAPGEVAFVAVLGGGSVWDETLPPGSRLSLAAQSRLLEGIRVQRARPGSQLVLSGWGDRQARTTAETMAEVAAALGVDRRTMVLLNEPRDTGEEARAIAALVGEESLVLVTSASHMPRAMLLFRQLGMEPIPAPAAHAVRVSEARRRWYRLPAPSPQNLQKSSAAIHEYLGIVWARITGR